MATKTSLGLDENLEGLLCYILGWITGLVFLIAEKNSKFVKFHAAQSLITFLGLGIVTMVLFFIPIIGWTLMSVVSLLALILWIFLMIQAYQGKKFKLPVVGDIAEKLAK